MQDLVHQFLKPVVKTTQTADVCREIVTHLMRGHWSSGEKIPPERKLCQELGVARASLREALKALEIMGMIETRLGHGTYVCQRSEFFSRPLLWTITSCFRPQANELIEALRLIEVELAGLAAQRHTPGDLAKIESYLKQMDESLNDESAFLRDDAAFHLALGEAAHNNLLMNALALTRNLLREWMGSILKRKGVAERALKQHWRIHLAVSKKDSRQARAAMENHLKDMAAFFLLEQSSEGTRGGIHTKRTRASASSIRDGIFVL